MTIELITFIASILFGSVIFWRESQGNGVYRFFNKIMNSKELQMKATDKKGFVYQQSFLLRLVFITTLFLIGIVITRFLIPIDLATISLFASMIFGTLVGTYVAGFIFKSSAVIEEQSESLEDKFQDVIEKGKDFIEDLQIKDTKEIEEVEVKKEAPKENEKSARERLKDKGVNSEFVTLHVGAGTFQPVRVDNILEHQMHSEYADVSQQVVNAILATKKACKRVIAVGTTSVRSIESAAQAAIKSGTELAPFLADTDIFIYPGYEFQLVDAMLTNFHLSESTLLMLVSAFCGKDHIENAYQQAIQQHYRFFSYGDAMFLEKREA